MIKQNRHREPAAQAWRSRILTNIRECFVVALLTTALSISPALAEEKKQETEKSEKEKPLTEGLYAPDFCDFEITFPEKPNETERCPQSISKCYKITNYVMVYDVTTSVDVSATCVPSNETNFKRYNKQVIDNVLKGMARKAELENGSVNTIEEDGVRKGSLLGSGTYGKQQRIYNAQIWVGPNSIMTVEAKLTGGENAKADTAYTNILKSIQKKTD